MMSCGFLMGLPLISIGIVERRKDSVDSGFFPATPREDSCEYS
jgi:hypothetical protein